MHHLSLRMSPKPVSLPSLCSIIAQAPEMPPSLSAFGRTVFVSKHNPAARSIMPHSSKDMMTSVADGSLGTPSSCFTPTPDIRIGRRSICYVEVGSSISFPSQCVVTVSYTHLTLPTSDLV